MKRKLFKALAIAGVLASSGAVFQASASQVLRVNVPFSFVVAGKEFSAGDYKVEETNAGTIFVQGLHQGAVVLSVPSEAFKQGAATALVFTAGQSRRYLAGVKVEGESSRAIPTHTPADRQLNISSR